MTTLALIKLAFFLVGVAVGLVAAIILISGRD